MYGPLLCMVFMDEDKNTGDIRMNQMQQPELRKKIVKIMTVAAHCKDRTYGEVADEIICLMKQEQHP